MLELRLFNIYELFISGIFHLTLSDHSLLQITEASRSSHGQGNHNTMVLGDSTRDTLGSHDNVLPSTR
jgi:hypothetical protein